MAGDPNCIFCKIADNRLPAAKVLETADVLAILDVSPVAPGHLLVMPREHYPLLGDTPPELLAKVAAELPRLARALATVTGAPGLNVIQNNGRVAGQSIDHIHFHLIPRTPTDRFDIHWARSSSQPQELTAMRDRIVAALA